MYKKESIALFEKIISPSDIQTVNIIKQNQGNEFSFIMGKKGK